MVHWLRIATSKFASSRVTLASTKPLYPACQGHRISRTLSCKRSQHTHVTGAQTRSKVFHARKHLLSSAAFAASAIVIWHLRQTTPELLADVNTTQRPSGRRTVAYRGIQHELCRIVAPSGSPEPVTVSVHSLDHSVTCMLACRSARAQTSHADQGPQIRCASSHKRLAQLVCNHELKSCRPHQQLATNREADR